MRGDVAIVLVAMFVGCTGTMILDGDTDAPEDGAVPADLDASVDEPNDDPGDAGPTDATHSELGPDLADDGPDGQEDATESTDFEDAGDTTEPGTEPTDTRVVDPPASCDCSATLETLSDDLDALEAELAMLSEKPAGMGLYDGLGNYLGVVIDMNSSGYLVFNVELGSVMDVPPDGGGWFHWVYFLTKDCAGPGYGTSESSIAGDAEGHVYAYDGIGTLESIVPLSKSSPYHPCQEVNPEAAPYEMYPMLDKGSPFPLPWVGPVEVK